MILKSNVEENAFLRIGREYYFKNLLTTTNCYEKARMVGVPREMLQDTKVKRLPESRLHRPNAAAEKLPARHVTTGRSGMGRGVRQLEGEHGH